MSETRDDSPFPAHITGLAAAGLGLVELAWKVHAGGPLETGSLALGVAVVAGVYGLMGLALGLLARAIGGLNIRVLRGPEAALALALAVPVVPGLLAGLWDGWAPLPTRALQLGMALAFAAAVFLAARTALRVSGRGTAPVLCALNAVAIVALLAAPLRHGGQRAEKERGSGPSALLVTIDTLRADHVGAYGHRPARTPVLDGLAAEGFLFERASTSSVLTGPSHTSILSGLLPLQHGVIENGLRVQREVPTVAETLSREGWDTAAFVSGFPVSNRAAHLLERFDHWDDDMRPHTGVPRRALEVSVGRFAGVVLERFGIHLHPSWRKAPRVTDSAVDWLERKRVRPFFAWVHYFDPHLPYQAPDELVDEAARDFDGPRGEDWYELDADHKRAVIEDEAAVERMGRLYDAEIALVDRELERLIATARRRAGREGLWIFVTADHGESFGEHGLWYRRELYDPSVRVPLIVVPPGTSARGGARIASPVRLIDVAPTLLDALGRAGAITTEGTSLLPLIDGETAGAPGPNVATLFSTRAGIHQPFLLSVSNARWKSIWRPEGWRHSNTIWGGEVRELYDLERDPGELHNLAAERPELWEHLRALAGEVQIELRSTESLSVEDLEALRSLGYTL